jgi:replicative DNA helicase
MGAKIENWSSDDIEDAVLSAIIQEPEEWFQIAVARGVRQKTFNGVTRQTIWKHIVLIMESTGNLDEVQLAQSILKDSDPVIDQVKNDLYRQIMIIVGRVEVITNFLSWIALLLKNWKQRSLLRIMEEFKTVSVDKYQDLRKELDEVEKIGSSVEAVKIDNILPGLLEKIRRLKAKEKLTGAIAWPLIDANVAFGEIEPEEFCVIAARPSVGKSSLAAQIAGNIIREGGNIVFHYLESSIQSLILKMASQESKADIRLLYEQSDQKYDELNRCIMRISEKYGKKLFIYQSQSISEMEASNTEAERKTGSLTAIFVDYIQLIDSGSEKENRATQIGSITRKLKHWTSKYRCPVIALAQLNRDVEKAGRFPLLSDLRESGSIEQDADRVVFIHRKKLNADKEDQDRFNYQEYFIIQAKMRDGPTDYINAVFCKPWTLFENYIKR